ncbi:hypothetical protein [Methanobrevibacter sp.]|jgi:hypothetical protein|uniref:hypothetical protein n=1 Tax=Methanobrevibacter sp. TaxID=66852 RepID=UPI003866FE34
MNVKEVEKINELISKAQISSAKSQGQIEAIKAEWKKTYGTDDEKEIKKRLQELEEEEQKTIERQEVLYNKLINSYDWDKLEEELA